MAIHPAAVIDREAQIDPSAEVGAYAVVERAVTIGPHCRLWPHAYVAAGTTLGRGVQVHPFAVVGHAPQDLKYGGEPTYTRIGDDTILREHSSIHRGTAPGSTTVVGARCFIMAAAHVGHNCFVGDDVKMANGVLLAGHCQVGSGAFLSGLSGVHQFVRIGELVMLGGATIAVTDVPPYLLAARERGLASVNTIGLRRAGFSAETRQELRECYRLLFRSRLPRTAALEQALERFHSEPARRLLAFVAEPSRRGLMRYVPRARSGGGDAAD